MFYKIKLKYLVLYKKKKKKKLNPRAVDTIDDIYLLFMEILIDIFQQEELL
jgi:hypothetical protein